MEISKDDAQSYVEQVLKVANIPMDKSKFDRLIQDKPSPEHLLKLALEMAKISLPTPVARSETSLKTHAEFERVWRDFDH